MGTLKGVALVGGLGLLLFFGAVGFQVLALAVSASNAAGVREANFTRSCEKLARANLNFPGSYRREWSGTPPYEVAGGLDMLLEFTATNAFNVPSKYQAYCTYRVTGNQVSMPYLREAR